MINIAAKTFLKLWICDIWNRSVKIEFRGIKIRDSFICWFDDLNKTLKKKEICL